MGPIGRMFTFAILTRYEPPPGIEAIIAITYYPISGAFSIQVLAADQTESLFVARPPWWPRSVYDVLDSMILRMSAPRRLGEGELDSIVQAGVDFERHVARHRKGV